MTDMHTDTQRDARTDGESVAIGSIYATHAMRPKMLNRQDYNGGRDNNNNNNNNSSHDNVYGAVIMTKVIARVHPVHLMNVD